MVASIVLPFTTAPFSSNGDLGSRADPRPGAAIASDDGGVGEGGRRDGCMDGWADQTSIALTRYE